VDGVICQRRGVIRGNGNIPSLNKKRIGTSLFCGKNNHTIDFLRARRWIREADERANEELLTPVESRRSTIDRQLSLWMRCDDIKKINVSVVMRDV
jgi:hypothetical protein